jgi:hypothetical protein
MESASFRITKYLGFIDSIFKFTEDQLYTYELELLKHESIIRSKFLNQRELLVGRRLLAGINRTGE